MPESEAGGIHRYGGFRLDGSDVREGALASGGAGFNPLFPEAQRILASAILASWLSSFSCLR